MKKISANLIYNPNSGQIWSSFKPDIVKEYLEKKNWSVTISETECAGDGTRLAKISVQQNYDVVIAVRVIGHDWFSFFEYLRHGPFRLSFS